jgi:magnesium transporter
VDEAGRLLGVVTVDDAMDILADEATEDIQRLGGSEPLDYPYFDQSILSVVAKRFVWLLPLFAASILTDLIIGRFSAFLAAFVTLAVFIPVVSGTAGNAGSQTVATIIRALSLGEIRFADLGRAWLREASIATLLGLALGLAGFARALALGADLKVCLVLALTLPLAIVFANSLATVIPLTAEKIGIDPAVVSTPMIATLTDASGILVYLLLATALIVP